MLNTNYIPLEIILEIILFILFNLFFFLIFHILFLISLALSKNACLVDLICVYQATANILATNISVAHNQPLMIMLLIAQFLILPLAQGL